MFSLDCSYEEYACETQCLPFTTMCDGVQDCVMNEVVIDELGHVCSGIVYITRNRAIRGRLFSLEK